MPESINPFNPGSGAPPPFLAGRNDEIKKFEVMLNSIKKNHNENLILTGLRGTGKTVLLNEFNRICLERGFFPIKRLQFSSKYCDPEEFIKALQYDISSAAISLSIKKKITKKLHSVGSYLKPKSVGIPDLFYYEPSYNSKSNIPFENHLEDYLSNNWKILDTNGFNGVVFWFDEFHTIYDISKKKQYVLGDFIAALNELQKKDFKYFAVFTGLPKLPLNVANSRSYSERMFKTMELGNLSKEEAKLAISKPLNKTQYSFQKSLIDKIIEDTGQYPYFIQFYCREIINNVNKKKITLNDYERIKVIIIKQLENDFFEPRIEKLSGKEEKLIIAMSKVTTKDIPFREILKKSKMEKTSLPSYLERLESKGLIYNHKYGVYRFSLPLLRTYIRKKYAK